MFCKVIEEFVDLDAYFTFCQGIKLKTRKFFEDYCPFCNCGVISKMASVHQGAFAAKKMREREEKIKASLNPMQYNTKFMDSIWGQYNRYSVHNLKKIMNERVGEYLVSPAEKIIAIPKKGEKIFSADVGSASPFALKRIYN
ncbi:unnamed protein product [Psylliodes chrysocephalus]|uniref:Uncharacterized protein n=1 Tax=Psylliodes chrysocephalus TaxID=3402493 RepID=A0A9P0D2F7_9CUCU|nr:unnamed protein product [Psylliodes chrysocephala]